MKTTLKISLATVALSALLFPSIPRTARAADAKEARPPLVQIAILLDTSGSMSGLIEQTKGQLWKIVNEFIRAKQNGKPPEVHVALYEYGNSGLKAESGWVRRIQPLTSDLDKISEELFALRTNGGEEYCGWVIRDAVRDLAWSDSPTVYKAIFIAGNEPFTQGPVNYAESCKAAIAKGIIVNTIHCGSEAEGIQGGWKAGAMLADGKYMVIDQNQTVVHFDAPQDAEIAKLSSDLNGTYVPYGTLGRVGFLNQSAQDANSATLAAQGTVVQRALTKSSANYYNGNWDLVDGLKNGAVKLGELKREELPEAIKDLPVKEQQAFIDNKAKERTELQDKIQRLNEERNRFVAEQMKKQSVTNTLDTAIIGAIREQATAKSYRFE